MTYYVLVPLPSMERQKCTVKNYTYVDKEGCVKDILSEKNFKELTAMGRSLINRLNSKPSRDVYPSLITFEDTNILQNLGSEDILYITAHGAPNEIGTFGKGISLAAEKLADIFQSLNLSHELQTIKLMTCDSAVDRATIDVYTDRSYMPENQNVGAQCYGEIFQQAMLGHDYFSLDVAAYWGELRDNIKSKKGSLNSYVVFDETPNPNIRASNAQRFFLAPNTHRNKNEMQNQNKENYEALKYLNAL